MKKLIVIFYLTLPFFITGQNYPSYLERIGDSTFNGYCTEYLTRTHKLAIEMVKAKFKRHVYYIKGQCPLQSYPWDTYKKSDIITMNDIEIINKDTIILLDGIVKIRTKEGVLYDELYYKDGFIQKYINRDKTYWRYKQKGKSIWEIAEYDYTTIPFKRHVIIYNNDGSIKINHYEKLIANKFVIEQTDETMTDIISNIKKIP